MTNQLHRNSGKTALYLILALSLATGCSRQSNTGGVAGSEAVTSESLQRRPRPSSTPALTTFFTISSPGNGSTFSGSFNVKGTAGTQWVNVSTYDLSNGSLQVSGDVSPVNGAYSLAIDASKLAVGSHQLAIMAFSVPAGAAGGTSKTFNLSVNIVSASGAPTGAAAGDLSITSYGAVASGSTNNLSAIQNAINDAKSKGVNVFVPAGTYGYSGVINLDGPVHLYGTGSASILRALDALNETIMVTGDGAQVSDLHLTVGYSGVSRQNPYECQRVTLLGAKNWAVDHVIIDGGSAAGIMASQGASHGVISHNLVQNTLADSIHMTGASSFINVFNNETNNSGDDGIAVVSYGDDPGTVHDIQAYNNHIHHNAFGRGMTVVGGNNVTYSNNSVHDNMSGASCFYIAQENSYVTQVSTNVTVQNNSVKNCGGMGGNHGGILVWGEAKANNNIKLVSNLIDQSANSNPTIAITSLNTNVSLINNKILGVAVQIDSSSQVIQNTPYSSGAVGYSGSIGP